VDVRRDPAIPAGVLRRGCGRCRGMALGMEADRAQGGASAFNGVAPGGPERSARHILPGVGWCLRAEVILAECPLLPGCRGRPLTSTRSNAGWSCTIAAWVPSRGRRPILAGDSRSVAAGPGLRRPVGRQRLRSVCLCVPGVAIPPG